MPRRTIEALIAKYTLEPTLRDVFVEGPCDRSILRWTLETCNIKSVQIFEIDTVDIPAALVREAGYTEGNKQRVLTLASELETRMTRDTYQASCIVDADCDRLLDIAVEGALVLVTDYTCMEMYLFDFAELSKFLVFALGCEPACLPAIDAMIRSVLRELFLIRAALQAMDLRLQSVDFTKSCSVVAEEIRFDRNDFIDRLLNKNAAQARKTELLSMVDALRTRIQPDPRHQMHGHDFVQLLTHYSRVRAPRMNWNDKTVFIAVHQGADTLRILGEGMFRVLRSRLTRDA